MWKSLRNFHDLSCAPNVITTVEVVGDTGVTRLTPRVLNGAFHETLVEISEIDHTVKYSIDDSPSPSRRPMSKNYIGAIQVRPVTEDGGAFVAWSSSGKRATTPRMIFVTASTWRSWPT